MGDTIATVPDQLKEQWHLQSSWDIAADISIY